MLVNLRKITKRAITWDFFCLGQIERRRGGFEYNLCDGNEIRVKLHSFLYVCMIRF
jgi:hypothetical protein